MTRVATMADVMAIEQTPLTERNLPTSTYDAIRRGAAIDPDAPALHFFLQGEHYAKNVSYSYRQLLAALHQTANLFHSLGLGPNDAVSMILPNLPQAFFTIFGGEAVGIVGPVNPMLEPSIMADIVNAANAKALVTLAPFPDAPLWDKAAAVVEQAPTVETILAVDLADFIPGMQKAALPKSVGQAQVLDFNAALREQPADRLLNERVIRSDDIASFFHTGGTTGAPKIAQHTHGNEVFDAWASAEMLNVRAGQVFFCGLPLYHVNGVIVTGLIPWSRGATVVLGTPQGYREPGLLPNFWRIVEHYGVNFFSGVPTVYSALLHVPIGESDVSSLEFAICGAAPMPVEVFREFEQRTGLRILEGYGLTEGTCVSSVNPPEGERRVGSIGFRLPYQEMVVARVGEDGRGEICGPNEIGSVLIRGANVFPGYLEAVHNRDIWVDLGDGEGPWLNTGDLGRMDEDGYFWLTGRKKELIIRGGHNIDPKLIEGPLHRHPAVALAAAVGRPDRRVGELPVAYVQLKPGASATEEELLSFAQEHIGERAAIPKRIVIIDAMPLTAVGKIFKPALVRLQIEEALSDALNELEALAKVEVNAVADKLYGTVAQVRIAPAASAKPAEAEAEARRILGQYAIHYELKVVS
ncbi:MAG: acyl-CoA synthetase [Chloroflexi bacterium]|nr:acyl-CoA synthetase [Chloroflexota bacterium]